MSELKVELLRGRLNPDRPPAIQKADFVKAWGNFDGQVAGMSTRDSFGVTNLSDNGIGNYGINLTTPMANIGAAPTHGGTNFHSTSMMSSVSQVGLGKYDGSNALNDPVYVIFSLSGDLA